jgi:hypothetical protein
MLLITGGFVASEVLNTECRSKIDEHPGPNDLLVSYRTSWGILSSITDLTEQTGPSVPRPHSGQLHIVKQPDPKAVRFKFPSLFLCWRDTPLRM